MVDRNDRQSERSGEVVWGWGEGGGGWEKGASGGSGGGGGEVCSSERVGRRGNLSKMLVTTATYLRNSRC